MGIGIRNNSSGARVMINGTPPNSKVNFIQGEISFSNRTGITSNPRIALKDSKGNILIWSNGGSVFFIKNGTNNAKNFSCNLDSQNGSFVELEDKYIFVSAYKGISIVNSSLAREKEISNNRVVFIFKLKNKAYILEAYGDLYTINTEGVMTKVGTFPLGNVETTRKWRYFEINNNLYLFSCYERNLTSIAAIFNGEEWTQGISFPTNLRFNGANIIPTIDGKAIIFNPDSELTETYFAGGSSDIYLYDGKNYTQINKISNVISFITGDEKNMVGISSISLSTSSNYDYKVFDAKYCYRKEIV